MPLLLTGDGQFLEITASLQYAIDAGRARGAPPVRPWRRRSRSLRSGRWRRRPSASVVGRRPLLDLLTRGEPRPKQAATAELQERLATSRSRRRVHGITFQDVHPPLAVVDAYRDVSRAQSDRQRRINEADAYRAEKLAEAEAQGDGDRERRRGRSRAATRAGRRAGPTRSATSSRPARRLPP